MGPCERKREKIHGTIYFVGRHNPTEYDTGNKDSRANTFLNKNEKLKYRHGNTVTAAILIHLQSNIFVFLSRFYTQLRWGKTAVCHDSLDLGIRRLKNLKC